MLRVDGDELTKLRIDERLRATVRRIRSPLEAGLRDGLRGCRRLDERLAIFDRRGDRRFAEDVTAFLEAVHHDPAMRVRRRGHDDCLDVGSGGEQRAMVGVRLDSLQTFGSRLEPGGRRVAERRNLHLFDLLQLGDDRASLASCSDDRHAQRSALDGRKQLVRFRQQRKTRERAHGLRDERCGDRCSRPRPGHFRFMPSRRSRRTDSRRETREARARARRARSTRLPRLRRMVR